jgi:heterodisulfide reductase subunit A
MSVARTINLEPLQEFDLPVNKTALVVGGGLAGMTCALSLANQGFEVNLVEKNSELGGIARRIQTTLEGLDVQAYLNNIIRNVYQHPSVHIFHEAVITEVSGYVGNFVTTVKFEDRVVKIDHGAVILATGAEEFLPTEYLYGEDDRILTQLELEEQISQGEERLISSKSLVMIQCVGCREEGRNYCSRICCSQAIKNALELKKKNAEMEIYILFRDIRTYGFKEDYYFEAADKDIKFIRWEPDGKPRVEAIAEGGENVLRITVPDPILGRKLAIDADFVVLSAAIVPSSGSKDIARLFKVPLNPDGFFQEAHVKLRPVDFAADGIFLCGINHYPKHISETISQAYGAAGRAVCLLSQDTVTASGSVCEVYENDCVSCGACMSACAYGAIRFRDTTKGKKAVVNPVLCKGDGLCSAKCPTQAIVLKHFTDEEVGFQIDAALSD